MSQQQTHPRAVRKSESAATKFVVSASAENVNWMNKTLALVWVS
jgi:hypothetical protein